MLFVHTACAAVRKCPQTLARELTQFEATEEVLQSELFMFAILWGRFFLECFADKAPRMGKGWRCTCVSNDSGIV